MKKKDKKFDLSLFFKKTSFVFFGAILVFFLYVRADDWLRTSSYFKIREIYCDPSLEFLKSSSLLSLKGKNLYALNLKTVERKLQLSYPQISDIKILKRYPDRLLVVIERRVPQARLNVKSRQVIIDEEGSILSLNGSAPELPLISGGNFSKVNPKIGDQIRGTDLKLALSIIKEFESNADLSRYRITRLNLNNPSEVFFYILNTRVQKRILMSENLKIIVDADNIKQKFGTLALLLQQTQNDLTSVEYIDLRFKEPIVKKN